MKIHYYFVLWVWLWCFPSQATETAATLASNHVASHVASPSSSEKDLTDSTVKLFNRDIVTFRGTLYGVSAQDRARRAQIRLQNQLKQPGPHRVSQKAEALGVMLQINGATTFWVTPDDVNKLADETLQTLANEVTKALELAIAETQESRDLNAIARALGNVAFATLVLLAWVWLLNRVQAWLELRLIGLVQVHSDRLSLAGVRLLRREHSVTLVHNGLKACHHLLLLLALYQWLSFVLASFTYTRVWGELMNGYLVNLAVGMASGIANALPGLFTAFIIFYLTESVTRLLDSFFERVQTQKTVVSWLEADVAEPTRRITKTVVWLFAIAMAYPYLPGSHTEAFQGLSVLVGLMISLGASNLVGQAASGLVLIYGRVFRKGEYIKVGAHEGTVLEMGMFTTRLRTGLGEDVTLSNSTVLSDATKNYSSNMKVTGFVLDTQVTIGYDTPWRQVHAMLELAARRTPGILHEPAPLVFQTQLSDWYPQYRLVCQGASADARSRPMLLSALLASVQDVFNEYDVQIMSPQYFEDPKAPKVVPPDKWYAAPAVKPSVE